jgi:hypothetical protein
MSDHTPAFTPADLTANQRGKLSSEQAERVQRIINYQQRRTILWMVLAHVFLVVTTLYGTNQILSQIQDPESLGLQLTLYFFVGINAIILFGYVYVIVIRPRLKRWGRLRAAQGAVQKEVLELDTITYFYLRLGRDRLRVPPQAFNQFEEGQRATIYWVDTPEGAHILSWA